MIENIKKRLQLLRELSCEINQKYDDLNKLKDSFTKKEYRCALKELKIYDKHQTKLINKQYPLNKRKLIKFLNEEDKKGE